jgi:hypothetical protein
MAVTIGEITVETAAPPADKGSGQDAGSGGGAGKSGDVKKEVEKTLYQLESRARRLWAY